MSPEKNNPLSSTSYRERKKLISGHEQEVGIKGIYSGTEKQNIALLKFLKKNPDFRKKWEKELIAIKNTKEQKKVEIRKPVIELGKTAQAHEGTVLHNVTTSAYTHSEDTRWGKGTAINGTLKYNNGTDPNNPISCSTNWAKYPPGTKLLIDGKYYAVHDYGNFVSDYPNRIDLYVPTKKAVNEWGLKKKDVTIIAMGDFDKARKILSEPSRQKFPFVRKMLENLPV